FAVLMPNEDVDFNEYAERLYTNDVFRDCISNSEGKTVRAYLPKFEFDYDCSLSKTLMSMGIKLAFNEKEADFTSMFGEDSVYVGDVLHKTHIEVNDEGTQAQAATAVEILEKGVILEEEMEEIRIDRPFFFCIYDNEIKAPIFIGAVKNLMGE
ncbi:MAG: serpin, partial [Clostridia bacterium]|nr:serpin [Clostridia bacterium]